jgi:hypothetical protein
MRQPNPGAEEQRAIRDTALREAWPYTDPRANYPLAEQARNAQAAGRVRTET